MDRFVRYDLHTKLNHCGGFLFGGNVFFYCLFFKFIQLHRPFLSCSVLLSPRQSYVPFRVQGTTRKAPFKVFLKCKNTGLLLKQILSIHNIIPREISNSYFGPQFQ